MDTEDTAGQVSGPAPSQVPEVQISHLTKMYRNDDEGGKVALKDVSLTIQQGDIYGIIGLSGAGKSTLVRCINGLEDYDSGSVKVRGREVGSLDRGELRDLRHRTAMIFQKFNLLPSRTVEGNVELPLRNASLGRRERAGRARQLLDLVGLGQLEGSYPNELSGGQQQRVAIARALANNPGILLSDEATSALDPNTTRSVLNLLRRLHDDLNITIVLITHEMAVVRQICNKVAVIDHGTIVERGRVFDVFARPQAQLTKSFVATTSNLSKVDELLEGNSPIIRLGPGQVLLRMSYVSKEVSEALVSRISRNFDLDVNIIFGDVDVVEGAPLGGLVVKLEGDDQQISKALHYLTERNIGTEVLRRG